MALEGGNVSNSKEEMLGVHQPNPVWCRKCAFSHGDDKWSDSPEKAYCKVYTHDIGIIKPASVSYGGKCEFYLEA